MATVKLGTLIIRTIAKPISARVKSQAVQHEKFGRFCVWLAQGLYRGEVRLRTGILGEPAKHIRPLSETRAIENGANALAEGFLFSVAAGLIIGETWRTSRNQSKRRDNVDEKLDELAGNFKELNTKVEGFARAYEERLEEEMRRNDELSRILERVVDIGLRGGWAEFKDTPLLFPRIQLARPTRSTPSEGSAEPPGSSPPELSSSEQQSTESTN